MHKKRAETADMEMTEMLLNLALRGTETDADGGGRRAGQQKRHCRRIGVPDGGRNRSLAHTVGRSLGQRLILPKTAEGAGEDGASNIITIAPPPPMPIL